MKRKEREHLRVDPFQRFIQKTMDDFQKYRREILISAAAVGAVILIIIVIGLFNYFSKTSENKSYSEAYNIVSNNALSIDSKIDKLSKMDSGKGISAAAKLFQASLYYEKGDLTKAKETLAQFPNSSVELINNQKSLLEADLLIASGKDKEALDVLNQLQANTQLEIPRDYVLIKLAKVQAKTNQTPLAVASLNKLMNDFPQSYYGMEARELLDSLTQK